MDEQRVAKTVFDDLGRDPTPNEIVSFVISFFETQGKRAVDPIINRCAYLSKDGLKCAMGCFLVDEAAGKNWDETGRRLDASTITGLLRIRDYLTYLPPPWMERNLALLRRLQDIHDGIKDFGYMMRLFYEERKKYVSQDS